MKKTKICTKCKIEKPLSEFYKSFDNKVRFHSYCKKCVKEIKGKCAKNSSESMKELRKWAEINSERMKELKRRAKNRYEKRREREVNYIKNLSDGYVKRTIKFKYNIEINMITKRMILIEKINLLTKRLSANRGENTKELLIQTIQQYKEERVML